MREIPAEFYRDLSRVVLPQGAVYIASLVMASAAAPDHFVKGGKARVFGTEDLASIVGNASVAATASLAIMHEVMDSPDGPGELIAVG